MKKICFVLTVDFAVKAFLVEHLKKLSEEFEISLIVNTKNLHLLKDLGIQGHLIPLNIAREISIKQDLIALISLIKIFRANKFDAVHSITPKAGLLAISAAFLAGIRHRTHTFTGQVWASKKGVKRLILKVADKLIAFFCHNHIVDSPSQLQFLKQENVLSDNQGLVFHSGSISGVNLNRFKPNETIKAETRKSLNIATNEVMFLFLGRLNVDKGVMDLANAFLLNPIKTARLVYVGPDEQDMQAKIRLLNGFESSKIQFVGHTNSPEAYMTAADVLCLPSYREGFGSVIIEAAACGVPALASRIYGITDAVIENETGLLHNPKNIKEINEKLSLLAYQPELRERLARSAYVRARQFFDSKLITQAWCSFYAELLK